MDHKEFKNITKQYIQLKNEYKQKQLKYQKTKRKFIKENGIPIGTKVITKRKEIGIVDKINFSYKTFKLVHLIKSKGGFYIGWWTKSNLKIIKEYKNVNKRR